MMNSTQLAPVTHEIRPAGPTGNRFDDEMRETAYQIWYLKADGNATRTHQLLKEQCRLAVGELIDGKTGEILEIDDDSLNIPTVRQIQRWAKDGNWAERRTQDLIKLAPKLWKDANARLFSQLEAAQSFDADVLAGRYDDFRSPGVLAIKEKVAARIQTLAGVGTAAGLQPVAMPTPPQNDISEDASPQELARAQREKLRELRGGS